MLGLERQGIRLSSAYAVVERKVVHRSDVMLTPYVSERRIQPGIGEWSGERAFIRNRLKTEIFNQVFGVEKGDEVEAQRDPLILKALEVVGS